MARQPVADIDNPARILTGTLFVPSGAHGPDYWEAPAWMADVVESQGGTAEMDTSRISPAHVHHEEEDDAGSTQYLSNRGAQEVAEAPAPAPAPQFRARVSKFQVPEGEQGEDYQDYSAPAPSAPQKEPQAKSPAMPVMTSGPLVKVPGFEDLERLVDTRPGEIGPHMALAMAYGQGGHTEHALREYRRILANRNVPAPMLNLLSERLDELEEEASGMPRYHQLRGDLYMKLGRYEEAIEEYNRIK